MRTPSKCVVRSELECCLMVWAVITCRSSLGSLPPAWLCAGEPGSLFVLVEDIIGLQSEATHILEVLRHLLSPMLLLSSLL